MTGGGDMFETEEVLGPTLGSLSDITARNAELRRGGSRPMAGRFPNDIIVSWATAAVRSAAGGAVNEENLRALLGPTWDPARSWEFARDGYFAMLNAVDQADAGLVLKLIVPLLPSEALTTELPSQLDIEKDVDQRVPPSLVIHRLMPRRDWEPVEEYRRPLPTGAFLDGNGARVADGLYIVFRTSWEIDEGAPFRRQLLFEHISSSEVS